MGIQADIGVVRNKERIIVKGWAGASTPRKCKEIPGARAHFTTENGYKEFAFWHYPLDMTTAKLLRAAFPDMTLSPGLWKWGQKAKARAFRVHRLRTKMSVKPHKLLRVPTVAPTIHAAMLNRGYQTAVPAFAQEVGSHFNADQPGLGKTIEELASLVECDIWGNILVIAPKKALRATWGPEIMKWLAPDVKVEIVNADAREGTTSYREKIIEEFTAQTPGQYELRFLLINPEMVRWKFVCPGRPKSGTSKCQNGNSRNCPWKNYHYKVPAHPALNNVTWDALLLDETHKYMMRANERSGSVSQVGFGLQKIPNTGYKVGMSGTPFKGKPRRFWTTMHWLAPNRYTGQGKWQELYFQYEADGWSRTGKKVTEILRDDRKELFTQDLAQIMIRRTKRELHAINPEWAPPEKQYVPIYVGMEGKQRRAYRQMEADAEAQVKGGTLAAVGVLAEITRLKQFANTYGKIITTEKIDKTGKYTGVPGSAYRDERFLPDLPSCKWDWIKNVFLAERGILDNDGESKVGIGSQFASILELISTSLTRLKVPHLLVSGKSTTNIEEVQALWQRPYRPGDPRVILLSTMAGGTALTLDAADDLAVLDEVWNPDDQEQLEDRFHRTSRTDHQVTIYQVRTLGTIDERIAESNEDLDMIQKYILDGSRGVHYSLKILGSAT